MYGVSVGNTAWMSTDFFSQDVRAMSTMWLTCLCWGSNVIMSSTFLTQMHSLTPSGTFGFYTAISYIGWVLIVLFYPDVRGLTNDETSQVFDQSMLKMVSFARKRRQERRAAGALVKPTANIAVDH